MKRNILQFAVASVATLIAVYAFQWAYEELANLSALIADVARITTAIAIWFLIDLVALPGINTIHEIQKGNQAVALTFVGYCILAGMIFGG